MNEQCTFRIGHGYDVHRFAEGRKLFIGGAEIPFEYGLSGHSDADVLLHAVMDALLGAAAMGDIGKHFPENDPAYDNADSKLLLKMVRNKLDAEDYQVVNVDATVIAQKPRLAPYIDEMRSIIASILLIGKDRVSVKATTEEGLGFTGRLEGISSHAVCIIEKVNRKKLFDHDYTAITH